MKRDFCETIPQLVHSHDPSGPPVVWNHRHLAQICQMRLESSLKWQSWVLQLVEYSSDSSKNCSTKSDDQIRRQPKCTKSLVFTYFAFIVLGKSEFWFPEALKAPVAWFLSLVCARGQVTIPWLKRLTDAAPSASEPTLLRFDPEGSRHKPGPWAIIMTRVDTWMWIVYALSS